MIFKSGSRQRSRQAGGTRVLGWSLGVSRRVEPDGPGGASQIVASGRNLCCFEGVKGLGIRHQRIRGVKHGSTPRIFR